MEHQAVYERLVKAARAGEFVHYGELARMLGIDMNKPHFGALVGKVLDRIHEDDDPIAPETGADREPSRTLNGSVEAARRTRVASHSVVH